MQQLLMILPVAVPVLFWAVYHYHKDRHLPEPLGNLVLTFVLGMLAVGISTALYTGLGMIGLRFDAGNLADTSGLALFAYSILAIGPIEEIAKLIPINARTNFRLDYIFKNLRAISHSHDTVMISYSLPIDK